MTEFEEEARNATIILNVAERNNCKAVMDFNGKTLNFVGSDADALKAFMEMDKIFAGL